MQSDNELAMRSGKGRASFPEALALAERKELMSESFSQYPVPDGQVSAPEAAGTLSPSDRLNGEIIGQSVEANGRLSPAEGRCATNEALFLSGTGQASTSRSKGGLRKGSCRTKGSGLAKPCWPKPSDSLESAPLCSGSLTPPNIGRRSLPDFWDRPGERTSTEYVGVHGLRAPG